jgi:hypothetical protein
MRPTSAPVAAVSEAYRAITMPRLPNNRALLICAIQTKFKFRNANLATLAATVCLIFLTETYSTTHQHQAVGSLAVADNQLAIAWSMLIGTFLMLFVVIFDLDVSLSGVSTARIKLLGCLSKNHSLFYISQTNFSTIFSLQVMGMTETRYGRN